MHVGFVVAGTRGGAVKEGVTRQKEQMV